MSIKKTLSENLYFTFVTFCAVIVSESGLFRLCESTATISVWLILITALIFMSITVFLYVNKKNSSAILGVASVFTVILLVLTISGVSVPEYFADTIIHIFNSDKLTVGEAIATTSILSAIFCFLFFVLLKNQIIRFCVVGLSFALLILYAFLKITPQRLEIFGISGLFISVLSELSLSFLYKKERKKLKDVMSNILPVYLAFSIFVTVLPVSDEPLNWSFIKNSVAGINKIITDIGYCLDHSSTEFDIGMQGYSDADKPFLSKLDTNDRCQLYLTCSYAIPRTSVYLIGNVGCDYTQDGWLRDNSKNNFKDDYYLDYCETISAFENAGLSEEDVAEFTSRSGLIIKYGDIDTQTMFYPLKTFSIRSNYLYNSDCPSLLLSKRADTKTQYTVQYIEINYHSKVFADIARNYTVNYDNNDKRHYLDYSIPHDIEETLEKRAEYIKHTYTDVPDCVTERTRLLADKVTEGCENDYDKLCCIEQYLNTYTYTLNPDKIPEDQDPVDYFLFDNKKGYCTYFASAMAIMARCEGIPTRYVQGFSTNFNSNSSMLNCPVSSDTAHAWVEAYIEGIGWIPFEPTSGYSDNRYEYGDGVIKRNIDFNNEIADDYDVDINADDINEITKNHSSVYILMFVLSVVVIVLVVAVYTTIKVRTFIKRYNNKTATEKFYECYRMIFYLFDMKKVKIRAGETATRFADRISERVQNNEVSFTDITVSFNKIRYGDYDATDKELDDIEKYVRYMFKDIAENKKKIIAYSAFVKYCFSGYEKN